MRASRVLLLPLLAVLLAAPARGADPVAAEFKQRTKFHLGVIKGNVKDLVKALKEEIPLTVPSDLLGWIFAAGPSATDQPALVILARPQLVDADD